MEEHIIETTSTSYNSSKLTRPIVIEQKTSTRKVMFAVLNDKRLSNGETVHIKIIHQKKGVKGEWENAESINLSTLKVGEAVKLELDSSCTKNIYDNLSRLYSLVDDKAIQLGNNKYLIIEVNGNSNIDNHKKDVIKTLLDNNYGKEIWNELIESNPDLATKLSMARLHQNRIESLKEFESEMDNDNEENFWQKFFEENDWIFGYGLNYKFLNTTNSQPNYGGAGYKGTGTQRGDFLLNSEAESKFTVLVEIKRTNTKLIDSNTQVRNGVYQLSKELVAAVTQIQINSRTWSFDSQSACNVRDLEQQKNIFTVSPKSYLIIGNTKEFGDNIDMKNSFECFRRNLINPEIITFDELLERARFIAQKTI